MSILISKSTSGQTLDSVIEDNITEVNVIELDSGLVSDLPLRFITDQDTGLYNSTANNMVFVTNGSNKLLVGNTQNVSYLPFRVPDGTVSIPSISFSSDPDTGIYWVSSGKVSVVSNGVDKFMVDNNSIDLNTGMAINFNDSGSYGPIQIASNNTTSLDLKSIGGSGIITQDAYFTKIKTRGDTSTSIFAIESQDETTSYLNCDTLNSELTTAMKFQGPNGSAAAPSMSFENNPDTGMYSPSDTVLGFAVDGLDKMNINSSVDALVLGVNNVLGQGSMEITNQGGENIIFDDTNQFINLQSNDITEAVVRPGRLQVSNQILIPDGLVSACSLAFTSSFDTGLFYVSGQRIGVACNGNQIAEFSASDISIHGPLELNTYTVATVPTATAGRIIYVSNGAAGNPVLAFGNGTNWLRSDTLGVISAT